METLLEKAKTDYEWKQELRGKDHPVNIWISDAFRGIIERERVARRILEEPGMPRAALYRALITEAGYTHESAAQAVAGYNYHPEMAGFISDRYKETSNYGYQRNFGQLQEPSQTPTVVTPAESLGHEDVELVCNETAQVDRPPISFMPELDHPGGLFRRLGRSVLVAVTRVSHSMSVF